MDLKIFAPLLAMSSEIEVKMPLSLAVTLEISEQSRFIYVIHVRSHRVLPSDRGPDSSASIGGSFLLKSSVIDL